MKAKILLVEDSESQGSSLKSSLERMGYTVFWARSGVEGLRLARADRPDVVLLDVVMTDMDGFSVCRWLKLHGETRDIPVIMLTVKGEVEYRVEGLNIGADDYLPKPVADEELEARIFAALRVRSAQHELRERNLQLESMLHRVEALAITDPLTGLYNRRRFADVLKREWAVARRYKHTLSCMMIDLDHFKQVNDKHGHEAGDQVLKEVAQVLAGNLREVDLPARYGGEEFAVLLPHTNLENALLVANRVAAIVRGLTFRLDDHELHLTASFGVAATTDSGLDRAEDLVRSADQALFRAKRQGRDCVVAYVKDSTPPEDDEVPEE